MNHLLENDFLNFGIRKELCEKLLSMPAMGHERKTDALIKWVGILEAYILLNLKVQSLLDVGCGLGPLTEYFKETVEIVYGMDNICDMPQDRIQKGIRFIKNDILNDTVIQENSLDLVIDACAIGCSMDIELVIKKISTIIKSGGYFISIGDTDLNKASGIFSCPATWIEICKKNGLELVGDYIENKDNLFLHYNNTLNIVRLVFKKL